MNEIELLTKNLKESFAQIYKHDISLKKTTLIDSILSFKESKAEYFRKNFFFNLNELKLKLDNLEPTQDAIKLQSLVSQIKSNDIKKIKNIIKQIDTIASGLKTPQGVLELKNINLPDAIKSEMNADINEMRSCFNNCLYRSAIILCGRVLEIALHRRYFEAVGVDLLEKSPGIGLGKIISKLIEKKVNLDPGLTQQIHLINQVRIFTVHKKQIAFYPSKAQAHAMILYTMDVLEKIF